MTVGHPPSAPAPPRGGPLGNYDVDGTAVFDLGPGVDVTINGPRGGVPESNCTIDETNGVRFTTTGQSTTQRIHIEAREKGSCRVEPSYSNFHITFGGAITGSGVMWLGQIQGGAGYILTCYSGSNHDVIAKNHYDWTGVQCAPKTVQQATTTITVTR